MRWERSDVDEEDERGRGGKRMNKDVASTRTTRRTRTRWEM
jgi:hypothetical protein